MSSPFGPILQQIEKIAIGTLHQREVIESCETHSSQSTQTEYWAVGNSKSSAFPKRLCSEWCYVHMVVNAFQTLLGQ